MSHLRVLPLLVLSLALPPSAELARAQDIPPFSQTLDHPTGHSTTSSVNFNTSPYDTAITFQPLAPPDNDYGTAPITTSLDFSGSSLHWQLGLSLAGPLFLLHSYTPTLQGNCVFRVYGVPLGDTAIVRVRIVSSVAIVVDGNNGLERGRVAISTNMDAAAHDFSHFMNSQPATDVDTLEVPVRVLGNDQYLQFQLSLLAHVEMLDSNSPQLEVTANASFLDVPPGMSVVNAYGYGSVVLGAPPDPVPAQRLAARVRADGRQVRVRGVAPGTTGAVLALFDLAGRCLAQARVAVPSSGDAELAPPATLASGIYFVRCMDTQGLRSTRFAFAR